MKILYICDEYPPGRTGGIGIATQTLARQLVKTGHKVIVAGLYDHGYGGASHESDQGIQVYRLRYGLPGGDLIQKVYRRLPDWLRRKINGQSAVEAFMKFLTELVHREKVDLVEVPDWHTFVWHSGCHVKWPPLPVPLMVKSHGSHTYFSAELGVKPIQRVHENDTALFARADALAAVSRYTAERNRVLFSPRMESAVLYNGIESQWPSSRGRDPLKVIFSGALSEKKGIHRLAEAWNTVHEARPGARLHVYGKGKTGWLRGILTEKARTSVSFHGHVSKGRIMEELSSAGLAVFPSYSETFGLMCVEAMMTGCPVVYTSRSCGPEIVTHEQTGLLADPDDVQGLARSILRLLDDEHLRKMLAENAKKSALERFAIEKVAEENVSCYRECVAQYNKLKVV